MHRFHAPSLRFLFALFLLFGAGRAPATPIESSYRVTIDTAALAGQSGYLDFLLLSLDGAAPVRAALSGFTGDYAAGTFATGDAAGSVADGVSIGNGAAWNEFAQWARFGGVFTFDLRFAIDGAAGAGANLGVALLDAGFNYLGTAADVVTFALQPGSPDLVSAEAGVAAVQALPEPSAAVQALTGMLAMAAVLRRKKIFRSQRTPEKARC